MYYHGNMERKPSKKLIGMRLRLIKRNNCGTEVFPGDMGMVTDVTDDGTVIVKWDSGADADLCWDAGDRWMIER